MAKGSGGVGKGSKVSGGVAVKARAAAPAADAGPLTMAGAEREVTESMLALTGGAIRQRVLLSDLRSKVGLTRDDFDTVMKSLQKQGKVVMYGLDNPMERTKAAEAGAVQVAGVARHIAYLQDK